MLNIVQPLVGHEVYSPSSLRPIVESGSVGWVHPGLVGRPKPSVDVLGQKVIPITTFKVAHTTRSPEILGAWGDKEQNSASKLITPDKKSLDNFFCLSLSVVAKLGILLLGLKKCLFFPFYAWL